MVSLRAVTALPALAFAPLGCADKNIERDAETKQKLVGTWYSTLIDNDAGQTYHLLVKVSGEGTFDSRVVVDYKDGVPTTSLRAANGLRRQDCSNACTSPVGERH